MLKNAFEFKKCFIVTPNGIPTCVAYPQNSSLNCFLAFGKCAVNGLLHILIHIPNKKLSDRKLIRQFFGTPLMLKTNYLYRLTLAVFYHTLKVRAICSPCRTVPIYVVADNFYFVVFCVFQAFTELSFDRRFVLLFRTESRIYYRFHFASF